MAGDLDDVQPSYMVVPEEKISYKDPSIMASILMFSLNL